MVLVVLALTIKRGDCTAQRTARTAPVVLHATTSLLKKARSEGAAPLSTTLFIVGASTTSTTH